MYVKLLKVLINISDKNGHLTQWTADSTCIIHQYNRSWLVLILHWSHGRGVIYRTDCIRKNIVFPYSGTGKTFREKKHHHWIRRHEIDTCQFSVKCQNGPDKMNRTQGNFVLLARTLGYGIYWFYSQYLVYDFNRDTIIYAKNLSIYFYLDIFH